MALSCGVYPVRARSKPYVKGLRASCVPADRNRESCQQFKNVAAESGFGKAKNSILNIFGDRREFNTFIGSGTTSKVVMQCPSQTAF